MSGNMQFNLHEDETRKKKKKKTEEVPIRWYGNDGKVV